MIGWKAPKFEATGLALVWRVVRLPVRKCTALRPRICPALRPTVGQLFLHVPLRAFNKSMILELNPREVAATSASGFIFLRRGPI